MLKIRKTFLTVIICAAILACGASGISHAYDLFRTTLSPSSVSSENAMTDESFSFGSKVRSDIKFMSVVYSVAQAFFEEGSEKDKIFKVLRDKFLWNDDLIRDLNIDLDGLAEEGREQEGFLSLSFTLPDGRTEGVIGLCPGGSEITSQMSDKNWERIGNYEFFIEKKIWVSEKNAQKDPSSGSRRKSFMSQIYKGDILAHVSYKINECLEKTDVVGAIRIFFTSGVFQDKKEDLPAVSFIFNKVIDLAKKGNMDIENARKFFLGTRGGVSVFSVSPEVSESVQIMSAQALSVLSWHKRGSKEASFFRISADPGKMAKAGDKDRGPSFLEVTHGTGIAAASSEGQPGFYWRGVEKIKKLGSNLFPQLMPTHVPESRTESFVMYAMNHGFVPVPDGLAAGTSSGKISTLHDTFFLNDTLPGSAQTTSTGAGHFQAEKLDIKYVTEGSGVQVNVRYNGSGEVEEVIVQEVREGDWTLALPGYVDYVINFGGLRFNDISVSLSAEQVSFFNRHIMEYIGDGRISDEDLKGSLKQFSRSFEIKAAPYTGFISGKGAALLETVTGVPSYRWIGSFDAFKSENPGGLEEMYRSLSSIDDVEKKVVELAGNLRILTEKADVYNNTSAGKTGTIKVLGASEIRGADNELAIERGNSSFSGIGPFVEYAAHNEKLLREVMFGDNTEDRLLRIPEEWIKLVRGNTAIMGILHKFQESPHGFVELYSDKRPEGVRDVYGVITKPLSDNLKKSKRTKANTVTLFPVYKGEVLPVNDNRRWGGEDYRKSIISPYGYNYDDAGVLRSIIMGLRLSVIAADPGKDENSEFVKETSFMYKELCLRHGIEENDFDLTPRDIVNMALGTENDRIFSLNKLIKLLPIMPFNAEELHLIYERYLEVMRRA
jgi:hypothetical protein